MCDRMSRNEFLTIMAFTNQAIMFGALALDGSTGSIQLAAPTGSPGQCWDLWISSTGGTYLSPTSNHGAAVDWISLQVTGLWDNSASSQNTWHQPPALYGSIAYVPEMFLTGYGQNGGIAMLQPNGQGGVEMGPLLTTFTLTTPPAYAPPPPPPPSTSYAPSGWVKVFEDLFTGTSLDTTKWWTRYAGNDGTQQNISSNGELQLFSESNNHVMTGSSVKLTAYPPAAGSSNYLSGMLRCKETFNFGSLTTGFYVEIVAKMPNAQGAWPALWFSAEPKSGSVPAPWPPEMDFAEFMCNSANGDTSSMVGMNVQLNGQDPGPWNTNNWSYGSPSPSGWQWSATGRTKWVTPTDFSAGFHTFGFKYVPGVAGQQTVNPITGQPTHMLYYYVDRYNGFNAQYDAQVGADGSLGWYGSLLIDLAVGGMGGGTPDPSQFPCDLEIQRVSIYLSQEDSAALVPSTIGQNFLPASGG